MPLACIACTRAASIEEGRPLWGLDPICLRPRDPLHLTLAAPLLWQKATKNVPEPARQMAVT